jgi:hypothetical protein
MSETKAKCVETQRLIPVQANEQLTKYGFSTWTASLDKITSLDCILDVAFSLLELGNADAAKMLTQVLFREYSRSGNSRYVISMS